jgi:hypothetical protein
LADVVQALVGDEALSRGQVNHHPVHAAKSTKAKPGTTRKANL